MNHLNNRSFRKKEYPPMHTVEHILNQTMVRLFHCERSKNAHIERKKSKCDYILSQAPSKSEITEIEKKVNEVIAQNLPVIALYLSYEEAAKLVDLSKLPTKKEKVRLVKIGEYDVCACIGEHVENTSDIGIFKITTSDYDGNRWRVRFKLQ